MRSYLRSVALIATCAGTLLCFVHDAAAQSRSQVDPGQNIEAGTAEFRAGHYAEAITLFRAAYIQSHQSFLLFNIAVAYDRSGDAHRALESYREYLATVGPDDAAQRATVEQSIARLEAQSAATPSSGVPAANAPAQRAGPVRRDGPQGGISPLLIVGSGVAVVAGASAVIVWALSDSLAQSYVRRCVGTSGGSVPATCEMDYASTQSELNTRAIVIDSLWVVAGVGAIGAAIGTYLTVRVRRDSRERALQPVIAPHYVGLTWRF